MMALEGVAELDAKLAELGRGLRGRVLKAAVQAGIERAQQRAEATVPVGTVMHRTYKGRLVAPGFTRRSVATKIVLDRTKERAVGILGVEPEAFYALNFVERGTVKVSPRPWLRPAFDATLDEQQRSLAGTLRREILTIAQRRSARARRRKT